MYYLLKHVRLSSFFVFFLGIYGILAIVLPSQKLEASALTLFSVNSFLYGFYLAPILGSQKSRIEELHKVVRAEANALFSMALHLKKMPKVLRNNAQAKLKEYISASIAQKRVGQGEKQYENLISFCVDYDGKNQEEVDEFLDSLVDNQKNRTQFSMLIANKVFAHEWMVILVLFSITLGFVLVIDIGDSVLLTLIKALLCTGLSMLLVILAKLSTLTHKKAKQVWDPLKKLNSSNFYRID